MKVFVLDDEAYTYRKALLDVLKDCEVTTAISAYQAKDLYKGGYDLLLLDHDMEGFFEDSSQTNTGMSFVKWLVAQENFSPVDVVCHSQNPDGRKNMASYLNQAGWSAAEVPYSLRYIQSIKQLVEARLNAAR